MNLNGKKLLMMGGGAYFNHIRKYACESGFKIIAVGNNEEADYYRFADDAYKVSTLDVEGIVEVVRDHKIDGLFAGSNETNILAAISVSEKSGVPYYADRKQWERVSDKAAFKEMARECGVPVVPAYVISGDIGNVNLSEIRYPVMIKPTDASCGRGLNVCENAQGFERNFREALRWSRKKEVLVEELVTDADEIFFHYIIQDGAVSLSSAYTKAYTTLRDKYYSLPLFHIYPSKYIDEYYDVLHDPLVRMIRRIGIENGCLTIQAFYKNGNFYVIEAAYRLGGAQNYIFTDYYNKVNVLNYMVNLALTGKMDESEICIKEDARFKRPCCNYYVGLNAGTIAKIEGVEAVRNMPGVLNVTQLAYSGDVIDDTNSNDRIGLRIHVVGQSIENLADNLVKICERLEITSSLGEDMIMEHLSFDDCVKAIETSIKTI